MATSAKIGAVRVVTLSEHFSYLFGETRRGESVLLAGRALGEVLNLVAWTEGDCETEIRFRSELRENPKPENREGVPYVVTEAEQVLGLFEPSFFTGMGDHRRAVEAALNEIGRIAYVSPEICRECERLATERFSAVNEREELLAEYDRLGKTIYEARREIVSSLMAEAIATQMPAIREFLNGELDQLDIPALLNPPAAEEELEDEPEKPDNEEIPTPPDWPTGEEFTREDAEHAQSGIVEDADDEIPTVSLVDALATPEAMADAAQTIGRQLGFIQPEPEEERVGTAVEAIASQMPAIVARLNEELEDQCSFPAPHSRSGNGDRSEA